MNPLLRSAAALLLFTSTACAQAAPRERVDAVAAAIEANYFDAERGRAIATDLRRDADAGAFDAAVDPARLADDLTARLRPLDRHFRVRWNAPGSVASDPAAIAPCRPRAPSYPYGIGASEVMAGNVGYLKLGEFAHFDPDDAHAPARKAIDAALARLAATSAMVVDVRGNRGGSPSMVGYLVSAFVPANAGVYNRFVTRGATLSEAPARPHATPRTDVPLYVLTDAGTASAAESFAYTLKSAGRAVVVGQRTAGAANPGGVIDIGHGFSVFVSNGTPVNPVTGGNWEAVGVSPDVETPSDRALDIALSRIRAAGYTSGSQR